MSEFRITGNEFHGPVVVAENLTLSRPAAVPPRGRPIRQWDPVALGIHRAIGGGALPAYVQRAHDRALRRVLGRGHGLFVVRGDSSTGKSRTLYEAVGAELPDWHVVCPRSVAALSDLPVAAPGPQTVIWLTELKYIADAPGGTEALAGLADLLDRAAELVVVTTVWPRDWRRYLGDADRQLRQLLGRLHEGEAGGVFDIPEFTAAELDAMRQGGDPALAAAAGAAARAGAPTEVVQYLSGVPDLLDHCFGAGADPYGQAAVLVAMDAARIGHPGPFSRDFLATALPGYLTDRQRAQDGTDWLDEALAYATRRLKGAVSALVPVAPESGVGVVGYTLADYLDQQAPSRREGVIPPGTFWQSLIDHGDPVMFPFWSGRARSLGAVKEALRLCEPIGEAGDIAGMIGAAELLTELDRPAEAVAWLRRASASDDIGPAARTRVEISTLLWSLGERAEALSILRRRGLDRGRCLAVASVLLAEAGEWEASASALAEAAGDGDAVPLVVAAVLLPPIGASLPAIGLIAVHSGGRGAVLRAAALLRLAGLETEAEAFASAAALSSPRLALLAVTARLTLLPSRGWQDDVIVLPATPEPVGPSELMTAGRLLVDLDRREEALVWYRAAAVDRSGYGAIATGQLGKLCGALGRHDEEAALVDEAGRRWWGLRAGSLRETTLSGVVEPAPSQLPVLAAHAVRCLPAVVFAVSMIGGQFLRRPTLALLPVSLVGACLIPALPLLALELWDPAWPSRLARLRASRRGGRGRRPRSRPGRSSG